MRLAGLIALIALAPTIAAATWAICAAGARKPTPTQPAADTVTRMEGDR